MCLSRIDGCQFLVQTMTEIVVWRRRRRVAGHPNTKLLGFFDTK